MRQVENLNEFIRRAPKENKHNEGLLKAMRNTIESHLDEQFNKTDNEVLKALHENAKRARIAQGKLEFIGPFKKGIKTPFAAKGAGLENVGKAYLKPASHKDARKLGESLLDQLPTQEAREAAVRSAFAQGIEEDEFQTSKFLRELKKFPKSMRERMFGKNAENVEDLLNYNRFFPGAQAPGYLPKTGAAGEKTREALKYLTLPGLIAAGAFDSERDRRGEESTAPAVLGLLGILGGARGATGLLRSRKLQEALGRSQLKRHYFNPVSDALIRAFEHISTFDEDKNGS